MRRIGQALLEKLGEPIPLSDAGVAVSVSLGALLFRGARPLPALLAAADRLMYTSKRDGKGRLTLRYHDRRNDDPTPVSTG